MLEMCKTFLPASFGMGKSNTFSPENRVIKIEKKSYVYYTTYQSKPKRRITLIPTSVNPMSSTTMSYKGFLTYNYSNWMLSAYVLRLRYVIITKLSTG